MSSIVRVKYWEIIADNLSKAGWSWGCVSAIDSNGRTIWIADAHRGDGKRFVVRAEEKLTAFFGIGEGDLSPPIERTNFRKMKIAKWKARRSHFYRCPRCGELVDKRELRDVIFHETDHKPNPLIPRIRGTRTRTRRR
jgi:hypothetical protein